MNARSIALVLLTASLSACKTVAGPLAPGAPQVQQVVDDRLIMGRAIPTGGMVSDADWEKFMAEVVTKAFPAGLSVFQGNGQWLDPRGNLAKEPNVVIEILHRPSARDDSLMSAVALEYKKRFGQDAVLRITSPATIRFY